MSHGEETLTRVVDSIEAMRPKILDISLRNTLLSTRFSDKGHTHVRVIDEVPGTLLATLAGGARMRLDALPPLDDEPRDEQTEAFREALAVFVNIDERYAERLEQIDSEAADDEEREMQREAALRELRDRVREHLGLPPRQADARAPDLRAHARAHHIDPHYELPTPEQAHSDGRHDDKAIQTFMLPGRLEHRCAHIVSKAKSFEQETGVQVLQCAFGFLEWQDDNSDRVALSPLLLLPVGFEDERRQGGQVFYVEASEGVPAANAVLRHKFRAQHGIELPAPGVTDDEGVNVEAYFAAVDAARPKHFRHWRVRRYVAIGVWPVTSLAMYEDLDTREWQFTDQSLITRTLGGRLMGEGFESFAEEHEVDDPEIESQVPMLVTDADASQFSAMVDVMRGEDLALEGPPGTGKSQTIVNTIAAALAAGEKVLFVAEKLAALDVVRARLDAMGLGEFLMNLQASQNSRQKVIASLDERLALGRHSAPDPAGLDGKIAEFERVRNRLSDYVRLMGAAYGETGLTYHQALGQAIATQPTRDRLPSAFAQRRIEGVGQWQAQDFDELYAACGDYARLVAGLRGLGTDWAFVNTGALGPFERDDLLAQVHTLRASLIALLQAREALGEIGIEAPPSREPLERLRQDFDAHADAIERADAALVERLVPESARETVRNARSALERIERLRTHLAAVPEPEDETLPATIATLRSALDALAVDDSNESAIQVRLDELAAKRDALDAAVAALHRALGDDPALAEVPVGGVVAALELLANTEARTLEQRPGAMSETERAAIEAVAGQVEALGAQRAELARVFDLSLVTDAGALAAMLARLRTKGAFSLLSADFRRIRKTLKGALRNPREYSDALMLERLPALIEHLREAEAFAGDPRYRAYTWFAGERTDTEGLKRQIAYQARAREIAAEHASEALANWLIDGDTATLVAVQREVRAGEGDLGLSDFAGSTPAALRERLAKADERLAEARRTAETVHKAVMRLGEAAQPTITRDGLNALESQLIEYQRKRAQLAAHPAREVLGALFEGVDTPTTVADDELTLADWIAGQPDGWRATLLAAVGDAAWCETVRGALDEYVRRHVAHSEAVEAFEGATGAGRAHWGFDAFDADALPALERMEVDSAGLDGYARRNAERAVLARWPIGPLLVALESGEIATDAFVEAVHAVVANSLASEIYARYGRQLAECRGHKLDDLRARLARLDTEIIELNRTRLRRKLIAHAHPPAGVGATERVKAAERTELALLKHEAKKKRGHRPVRELTARAGAALRAIKPCWLMSPLTVAKYLPRESGLFDLVVIDEGSQMRPENALGALLRARRVLVVGDTNQLPPSDFFRKVAAAEAVDEDDESPAHEESILDLANTALAARRRLRWHYRSRHEALIAFCNRQIYNDDLVVFPAARRNDPALGVRQVFVEGGRYQRSRNPEEARWMVDAIIRHMAEHPERSLGVVVLNNAQQELLEDEYRAAALTSAAAQHFETRWESERDALDRFFIKNLENVQGDERDVIFIGTVFGPDPSANNRVLNRFGPINGVAGRRRLNVLFSRAKEQVVTFTSMRPEDIRAEDDGNPGAVMLRRWLEYTATGRLDVGEATHREPDSDFERHVIGVIEALGYEAVPQVGVQGFFIDIGVRHTDYPYGYLLGVECDGATYHSTRAARDRDRLRQEVLEAKGWALHRIWSTDWFTDPLAEREKLKMVLAGHLRQAGATSRGPDEDAQARDSSPFSEPEPLSLFESEDSERYRANQLPQHSNYSRHGN